MATTLMPEQSENSVIAKAFKDVDINGVLSFSKDALLSTSYVDDYMIQGFGFGCEDILLMTAAGGATPITNFIFDTHGVDADKTIILNTALYNSSVGVILSEFYLSEDEGAYTGGTEMLCGNLNETSIILPQTCVKYGAVQVTAGKTWKLYKRGAIAYISYNIEYVKKDKSNVSIYINGIEKYNTTIKKSNLESNLDDIVLGYDGITDGFFNIDELHIYNTALTSSEIAQLYNNGLGRLAVPTGVTEATELLARFHFDSIIDNDNDSTLGATYDLVRNGTTSVEYPLIVLSGTLPSFGVVALSFNKDVTNEVFFTAQLPHSYMEGTDIDAHVHFLNPSALSGDVVWGLEYQWLNIDETNGNTTIVTKALTAGTQLKHVAINIQDLTGTGKEISSVLNCRLFRDGANVLDTLDSSVYLLEFDFHYQVDTVGSRTQWTK